MAKKSETPEMIDETQELQNTENTSYDTDSVETSVSIEPISVDNVVELSEPSVVSNDETSEEPSVTTEPVDESKDENDSETPETVSADVETVAKELSKFVEKFFKFHQDLISYVNEPENKKFTIILKYSYAREPEINKVAEFFKTTIYDSSVVFDEALKVTCVNCNDTTMKFVTLTAEDYEKTMKAITDGSSDIAKSIASRLSIVPKNYYTSEELKGLTDKIVLFINNMNGNKDGPFITSTYSRFGVETKMAGNNLMFTVNTDLLNKRCVELGENSVTECEKAFVAFNPEVKTFLSFVEKYGMNALVEIDKMLKEEDSSISLQRKSGKTLIFIHDLTKKSDQKEDTSDSLES